MPIIEFDEGQPGAKGSFSWGEDLKPEADENAQLLAWWHALSRDRGCPQFPEVDLLEQPEIIPRLSIVECQRDRDCFVIKMMGSEIVSTYGKDTTGEEISQDSANPEDVSAYKALQAVLDLACPVMTRGRVLMGSRGMVKDYVSNETLFLPFSDENEKIIRIITHQILFTA